MARETWIKVSEAASRIGASVWTVYALIHARKLDAYQDEDTNRWRVESGSVDAYLRARRLPARAVTVAIAAQAERLPMVDEPWRGTIFGRQRHAAPTATPAASLTKKRPR